MATGYGDANLGYACYKCRRASSSTSTTCMRPRWTIPGTTLSLSAAVPVRLNKDQEPRGFPDGLFGKNYDKSVALGNKVTRDGQRFITSGRRTRLGSLTVWSGTGKVPRLQLLGF